ncbi:MAG: hypothetical protein KDA24_28500, partial [Deltaproteobacteria bacterium]|nr:hypothetical protein [Deltaproteobacteria bacterium]
VESMFLAQIFFAAHQSALARVLGNDPVYWETFEEIWAGYSAAMLLERRLVHPHADCGEEEYDAILKRSLPLLLPSAALLRSVGAWDQFDDLEDLVLSAVRAAQLFNDAMDVRKDLAAGRHTWVVRRFGGAEGEGVMMRKMVLGGGIETVFKESSADLDRAKAAAERMGLPSASAWIDRRKEMMDSAIKKALQALFSRLLSAAAPD